MKNRGLGVLSVLLVAVVLMAVLPVNLNVALAASVPTITYRVHCQTVRWTKTVKGGSVAGTTGKGLRMEALCINLKHNNKSMIKYRVHVPVTGWMDWKNSGEVAGTTGQSKAIEAVQIKLVGDYAKKYDVWYRTHVAHGGWLAWTKNGKVSGSTGMALRTEAIQIKLVPKGTTLRTTGLSELKPPKLRYRTYVQSRWSGYSAPGGVSGTTGKSLRMEGLRVVLKDFNNNNGILYRAHVSKVGWQSWRRSGQTAGTTGRNLAIEAVQIKLTSTLSKYFDIYYRLHIAKLGWLGWARNGEIAGSTGRGLQGEAIQICLVSKDKPFSTGGRAYYDSRTMTAHTADEAISWCYSQLGNTVGSGECVALVKAYYQYLGVSPVWGDGVAYAWNPLPKGWTRVQGGQPRKGDILVYGEKVSGDLGHVAIYESDWSVFHQNVSGRYVERYTKVPFNGMTNPYWGYIRPDFKF